MNVGGVSVDFSKPMTQEWCLYVHLILRYELCMYFLARFMSFRYVVVVVVVCLHLRKISGLSPWSKYTQPEWGTVRGWIQRGSILFLEYFNIDLRYQPSTTNPYKVIRWYLRKISGLSPWSKYTQPEWGTVRGWILRGWIVL